MEKELKELKTQATEEISKTNTIYDIEEVKVKYLGKKGLVTNILKQMGGLSEDEKKSVGKLANEIRNELEKDILKRKEVIEYAVLAEKMQNEKIDITMNKNEISLGHKHPITQTFDELKDIFIGMGFEIKEGPEIEYAEINFDKLNTPKDHPARDVQDTLYITEDIILRTQTSPVQVRTMLEQKPPLKIIVPGRVYRSDTNDATHSPMFHQLEGLVVGENITMGDLKGTLELFVKKTFGKDTKIRLRPHHFPFTEPSVEVDVSCYACGGVGCRTCKDEGFIEILGAGMVHPNVLENGGIDSKKYSGFAFGFGVDRIAVIKHKIPDMRYLFENDIRFLEQF